MFKDEEIWDILEKISLKEAFQENGLETLVNPFPNITIKQKNFKRSQKMAGI